MSDGFANVPENDKQRLGHGSNEPDNIDDFSIDQSFEVIPSKKMNGDDVRDKMDGTTKHDTERQKPADDSSKGSTNNDRSSSKSFQERIRRSGSFLTKLQTTSTSESKDSPGFQSSIASAFSSFTSSFSMNSSPGGNISNNNNNDSRASNYINSQNNISNSSSLTIETISDSTNLSQISESKDEVLVRKASLERKNLINLTKLIVKDLIATSLNMNRTFEDIQNAIHLKNYFTLVDKVLKHGLKHNLLSNRSASLWSMLETLPKHLKETSSITESVRSLSNTRTFDGKIKAWVRVAMMQKRLPECFNQLLSNQESLLREIYHDYAFMLSDEAHVFAGLIIGVNVIDCNFFAKDVNLDLVDDIIDLSPYLKAANCFEYEPGDSDLEQDEPTQVSAELQSLLDQKNYLEEYNKRLESTITNMETKIKSLEGENKHLEDVVKSSKAQIQDLVNKIDFQCSISKQSSTDNNQPALVELVTSNQASEQTLSSENSNVSAADMKKNCDLLATTQSSLAEKEKELSNFKERVSIIESSYRECLEKIKVLEHDLELQTSSNAGKDVTIKIYEKDIKDNQASLESLRSSLMDSNKLNTELTERLNDMATELKEKTNTMVNLQNSLEKSRVESMTLASRLKDKQTALLANKEELEKALNTINELKGYNVKINDELCKERESGQSSSVTVETQNLKIAELTTRINTLEKELEDHRSFKEQARELALKCNEYERSLEEIGSQLRESRLEYEDLRENSSVFLNSQWIDSKQVKSCALCQQLFSVTKRKHHCRLCGNVFCQTCSDNKMELASSSKPVRVCDTCHPLLLAKFVKSPISKE